MEEHLHFDAHFSSSTHQIGMSRGTVRISNYQKCNIFIFRTVQYPIDAPFALNQFPIGNNDILAV